MILALIITLIVLGIAFLLLEIFFLPGITIAGIAGGLCLAAAACSLSRTTEQRWVGIRSLPLS